MNHNQIFGTLLDVIPFPTSVVDINTFKVIYTNKALGEKMFAPKEEFCWKKIYGQENICSWCTIPSFSKHENIKSGEKELVTFFDENSDTWFQSYDEIMTWPNGELVKCTIAVDITEQKEILSSLIQTHTKLARQTRELEKANEKYEQLSKIDYLTGVNNRRNFFYLGEEIYKNDSECIDDVFVALLDIDNFKQLNDKYGHHIGDKALILFTNSIQNILDKKNDIFGRIGGEEFALITRFVNKDKIFAKIDGLRKEVESILLEDSGEIIKITVSIGFVQREVGETLDISLEKADRLLYDAKHNGRNQVKFRI